MLRGSRDCRFHEYPSFEWKSAVAATNWVSSSKSSNLANPCEIEVTQSRSSHVNRVNRVNRLSKLNAQIGKKVSSSSHLEMIGQGDKVSSSVGFLGCVVCFNLSKILKKEFPVVFRVSQLNTFVKIRLKWPSILKQWRMLFQLYPRAVESCSSFVRINKIYIYVYELYR